MAAARPAARPAHTLLELLLRAANAALARLGLLRILDPTDELVARERRDVGPGVERRRVAAERLAQILGKLVHHAVGHSSAAHGVSLRPAETFTQRSPRRGGSSPNRRTRV